jgi:hypothetical protein
LGSQRRILIESLGPIARLLISEPVSTAAPRRWSAAPDAPLPTAAIGSLRPAAAVEVA